MAKAQAAARMMTEVAPPQLVSVVRRNKPVARRLDTIAEDDIELQGPYGDSHHSKQNACSAAVPVAFKPTTTTTTTASGFMRELSKCFSTNNVHCQKDWPESSSKGRRRPASYLCNC